ncbi:MAG: 1-deoxy-D-xylulose-5-phosphate synthase [Bacteroidales bacterium]
MSLLDRINSPKDIKGFSIEELRALCAEIRKYMVDCCAVNPGHLASSLGAVELIVGLHYVFDTPEDKLVFDVGHQAYAHKILTGRREIFKKNRKKDGISGFPLRSESEYDAFGTGHSSTSISAALGIAEAAKLQGLKDKVVALIGDGALTGGLALEGLNNAGNSKTDLLVVLNDNNISIDRNIGALHDNLLRITTSPVYNKIKDSIWKLLGEGSFRKAMQKLVGNAKATMVRFSGGDLFEALGFRYFGPINGNDIEQVVTLLKRLKDIRGPRILHAITVKGKGYAPAEADPTVWHAPGRFDPETGERITSDSPIARYQDVFGAVLIQLAKEDRRIVGVTPAMAAGCGMHEFADDFPDRFFDVGIEEEHAVTFSAGLAAEGMRPFCNIYSSFSQRAYDEIIHDTALQSLPVVFCFDRAGLVGEDGATHHGCFDLAAYRSIPGVIISSPKDETELKNLMYTALHTDNGPFIIRYPRGRGEGAAWRDSEFEMLPPGRGEMILEGERVAVFTIGNMAGIALEAAEKCEKQTGRKPYIYNMRYLKPLDTKILEKAAAECDAVVTVEDGCVKGGLFGAVTEYMAEKDHSLTIKGFGIPDKFIKQDTQAAQLSECGLDCESLYVEIMRLISK